MLSLFNKCVLSHNPSIFIEANQLIFYFLKLPARFYSVNKSSHVIYPWMDRRKPYWVKQESDPRCDEDLTVQNKHILELERMQQVDDGLRKRSPVLGVQHESREWIANVTQRCGLIGIKLGMYPMWTKSGVKMDCTVLQIPDSHALRYVPPSDIDKYLSLRSPRGYWLNNQHVPSWINQRRWGLQLVGAVSADPIEFTPSWCGLFNEAGVPPKRKISRFLVSPDAALEPGTPLNVQHFRIGDYVDITARTINRGFQGVIERWGMKGGPAAHGSTKFHRKMGSAGGGGGKIVRGKRMPGVMGNRFRHLRGLMVVRINPKLGLLYVVGPTPGPVHSYCLINDSWLVNRRRELDLNPPSVPTWFPSDNLTEPDELAEFDDFDSDLFHDSIHRSDDPSISYVTS